MESKINVTLRVKPLSADEARNKKNELWKQQSDTGILNTRTNELYTFDRVFPGSSTTQELFDNSVKDIVHAAMTGIN